MKLGYVIADARGSTDLVLAETARRLMAEGLRLTGVVQTNIERCAGREHCDMDLQVLPGGPVIRISQILGTGSRGCRLDPGALETAVAEVGARLGPDTGLLLINKFGKHEAEGRGFRELIGQALSQGVPVLFGLNAMNRPAFEAFAGPLGEALPADCAQLADWVRRAIADRALAA